MRLSFLLPGRGRSGGVRCTVALANHLIASGYDVRLFYHKGQMSLRSAVRNATRKLLFPNSHDWLDNFNGDVSSFYHITECAFAKDEVCIAVGMWCSSQLKKLNLRNGLKLQYLHGLTPWMPEIMKEALSLDIPKIAVSSVVEEKIKSDGKGEFLGIVPSGIDQEEYFPISDENGRDGIGTIYSSHPAKDPKTVLAVLNQLKCEQPDIPQYIFGSSRRPRQISKTDYAMLPSVKEARRRYSRSLVWILGSNSEGFGMPILEAMACGCAVVATDCGGPRDIIKDGENGFLVEVGNSDQLVDRTETLLANDKLRETFVARSKDTIKRFSWEQSIDKLEKVLWSLSNSNT